ncbi:hypothetical protein [Clostridium tarantellae]|uniref:Trypsin-like serine protease n=1 Tax=Clostridium tarantellae TaxID=39493 RepID=A0A6I1MKV7_9CLOT|nr:hypothetical protein [Clostridium tarantellae]MPQ43078.1 hypothetical protein [Clostridium tarantellae]
MIDYKREQCRIIIQNDYHLFLKKQNVVGLAFGYKINENLNTKEPCLKVLVKEKVPSSNLKPEDLIPEIYRGFKTDIIETGDLSYSSLRSKNLPLQFGYSIGPANVELVGSAGCLVKDCCKNYYILSNSHLFSFFDTLPIGTPILHPGVKDGGIYPKDLIAILSKTVPIISSIGDPFIINYVDCALAKIINPRLITKKLALIGNIKGLCPATLELNVKKVGRTTSLTTGMVIALDAVIALEDFNDNKQIFVDQIITTHMSDKGDSGSLVLDKNNNAIGLIFANSSSISILNPIKLVLDALKVSIVTS